MCYLLSFQLSSPTIATENSKIVDLGSGQLSNGSSAMNQLADIFGNLAATSEMANGDFIYNRADYLKSKHFFLD
jgi:hypothetical protein